MPTDEWTVAPTLRTVRFDYEATNMFVDRNDYQNTKISTKRNTMKYDNEGYIANIKNIRKLKESPPFYLRQYKSKDLIWMIFDKNKCIWQAKSNNKRYIAKICINNNIKVYVIRNKKTILTNLTICLACGKLTKKHKNNICSKCRPYLKKCKTCDSYVKKSWSIKSEITQSYYCANCWNKKYYRCATCGLEAIKKKTTFHIEDRYLCDSCFERHTNICYNCKNRFFKNSLRRWNNQYYCDTCYEEKKPIKSYDYIPIFKFAKRDWDNNLYLGIELEVEPYNQYIDVYDTIEEDRGQDPESRKLYENWAIKTTKFLKQNKLNDYFYLKHDGTLRGFELISHPATLGFIHDNLKFYKILEWFKENNFTSFKSGRCGLHIHLNRQFFNRLEKEKIRMFFISNRQILSEFSKRKGKNSRYFQYERYTLKNILYGKARQANKYFALRMKPDGKSSIEMRIFRGTLSYPRFIATLQFSDALCHFVKETSIINMTKNKSWYDFIDWCGKTCNYGHFLHYIENNKQLSKLEEDLQCV